MILTVTDNEGETASDAECDDGVFCNGAETCDEVPGYTHTPIAQYLAPLPAASRLGNALLAALLLATTIITFRKRRSGKCL